MLLGRQRFVRAASIVVRAVGERNYQIVNPALACMRGSPRASCSDSAKINILRLSTIFKIVEKTMNDE